MTSIIASADGHLPVEKTASATSAPRKRKRRQRSGGAIEDCFTCSTRGTKCDRKRPYCTQCIEIGKECSGYRTTLTWGVGVASRGKLRGLSCPVANKNADGSDVIRVHTGGSPPKRRRTEPVVAFKEEEDAVNMLPVGAQPEYSGVAYTASDLNDEPVQAYANTFSLMTEPAYHEHMDSGGYDAQRDVSLDQFSYQNIGVSTASYDEADALNTTQTTSSHTAQQYYSPLDYVHTPFHQTVSQPTSTPYPELGFTTAATEAYNMNVTSMATSDYGFHHGINNSQGGKIFNEAEVDQSGEAINGLLYEPPFKRSGSLLVPYSHHIASSPLSRQRETHTDLTYGTALDTRFMSPFSHISPRLQSWMEYYDRNVCTYLVAFDGPDNPYRKHVLQLAVHNEGLQHAIAALSTNNFRMRRKELRRFGFADEITDAFRGTPPREVNDPSAEESCYKQMAIDHLNTQLTDRRAAQDDSVLATLLVLCLFHVCDSGFSKFKTQLAGVQKLLAFREPNTQSEFTRWIQMFFTWFDVMTSSVNDREMQIRPDSVAMLDFSSNLGAMEQFSGCDGKLFKLIARLGRLNLLAQGRPVRSSPELERPTFVQRSTYYPAKRKSSYLDTQRNRPLTAADFANIDGNGWGTPIIPSDDEGEQAVGPSHSHIDHWQDDRSDFWAEWHDIRSRLQSFQMDLPNIPSATSPNVPSDPAELELSQRDMLHINESFRCSALLYTERLGHPLRPSGHYTFQRLVAEALYHITSLAIDSCVNKFLLWPLFIIGTECVDEEHREIIRRRCIEVQKESGFYNNISSLEVLEKVWAEACGDGFRNEADEMRARRKDSETGKSGRYGQAFRWRKAMDRVDGEYIVV